MFKVTIEIPERRIAQLLCTGIEGGINYWCARVTKAWEGSEGGKPVAYLEEDGSTLWVHDYPLTPGGVLYVKEQDGDTQRLDREAILRGIALLGEKYSHHWADFIGENEDATTGDVFIQLCLFGELRYG